MARDVLDTELTALVGESYNRAYGAMVQVQLLSELEEVIEYKMHPERRDMIRRAWWDRLQVRGEGVVGMVGPAAGEGEGVVGMVGPAAGEGEGVVGMVGPAAGEGVVRVWWVWWDGCR